MNTQQALQVIVDATGSIQATRQQHNLIAQAIDVLNKAITPPPAEPKAKEATDSKTAMTLTKAGKETVKV